ncbi:hypothetical protein M0R88_11325 [Halorussus gelatinilyticus]|uniref:Uncharacterized protein n=1 Tax=Halorussus gelatinilyticus TaxID=2937524 RepID=A0A8U0IDW4_9EURY|nr:hypothetical protein [Halorussus gelatinilyticus]UPV99117.1 hypothetical protein M0R88_11325 [Halorussus gelatinilyticus]
MTIRDRLRDDPEPVSPEQVMRYWLDQEIEDEEGDPDPDALDTEPALREELFERKPIAERVFTPEPADWYRADLSEAALRDLRVVVGEPEQGWRGLADDNRVESIAERIRDADDVAALESETSKDLEEVVELADDIEDGGPESRLVVLEEGDDPAYVADGNHRTVAHVLYLLRGGEFEGQEVYLGVRE